MKPPKVVQIVAKDALRHDGAPRAEKLILLDDHGRVFEHFSDTPEDELYQVKIVLPPLPKRQPTKHRGTRKK